MVYNFVIFNYLSFKDTAITVVLGTNTLDKGGDEYSSIKKWVHPNYNSAFIKNDIGLIKVDKDIVFGDKVKPIALPTKKFDKSDYPATLSGWGTTSVNTKRTCQSHALGDIFYRCIFITRLMIYVCK